MESKPHQIFRQKIEVTNTYLQSVYGALKFTSNFLNKNKRENSNKVINIYLGKDFNRLNQPLSETTRIFNYSKSKICEYYIINLYKTFDEYLQNTIYEVFKAEPQRILGLSNESVSFSGIEIIELGSYKEICDKLITNLYRKLENLKSTKQLLEKYVKVFNIQLENNQIENGLAVLELRHLVIHNNSKIDKTYENKFPFMNQKGGNKISTNFNFVNSLEPKISELVDEIDNQLLAKKFLTSVEKT